MRRLRAIPLADAAGLDGGRRRALALRGGALAAVAALAATLAVATGAARAVTGSGGRTPTSVVVVDVSGSIAAPASATIERALRTVARQGGDAGLVLFSDDTEEVVPPTAPASQLLAYMRLFRRPRYGQLLENPWTTNFSFGTQIGRGLAAARDALARAHVRAARVILVSDLDDSGIDVAFMRRELLSYARDPQIRLRVAAVPGFNPVTGALYRRILGRDAFAVGKPPSAVSGETTDAGGSFSLLAVVLAIAAALAVAAHELLNAPLAWREARA